jgi:hypothetical protein
VGLDLAAYSCNLQTTRCPTASYSNPTPSYIPPHTQSPLILNKLHNRRHRIRPKHNHRHNREVPTTSHISLFSTIHHPILPHPSSLRNYITRMGNGLLDIHHGTPTDFLPLRGPSRSRSSTGIGSAHSSISPELLDCRSLDPRSREGGEHGAAKERRHCLYCRGGVEWRLWGWINLVLDLRLRIQGDRKE